MDNKYYTDPMNDIIGFNQTPQDQFVDNRTTSAGNSILDTRTMAEAAYDNQINNQALYDISLDLAIPAGSAIASGLGNLGKYSANSLRNFMSMPSSKVLQDTGRREALKLAGTGIGAAAMTQPLAKLASSGLGLSDNVASSLVSPVAARAPVSLVNLRARKEIFDRGLQKFYTKQNGTLGKGKLPSLTKLENNADDLLKKTDPDFHKWMKTNKGSENADWDAAYEHMHVLRQKNPELDDAYNIVRSQENQIRRVSKKLKAKESKAIYSDTPRLSPKELTSEIKILKDEIKRRTRDGRVMPKLIKKSTEKRISQMTKQLNELSRTGKYSNTK